MGAEGENANRELSKGNLTLRSRRERDGYVVGLSGELDLAAVEVVAEEMDRIMAIGDGSAILLDLRQLEFIDSTGIQLLLQLDARSSANGGGLKLTRGSRAVQRVLELTGADSRLPFLD